MPAHRPAQDDATSRWHSGRTARKPATTSDVVERLYGVAKPDAVEEFLRDRSLDALFGNDEGGECPCGSGESYAGCHGQRPAD
jgi:hypothetical protein